MRVSITDIGKKLGISHQTVSYVLNDRWREKRISEKTKDLVLKTARELNYRPNKIAQSLLSGKTDTLGLIIPCITYSVWPLIARAIEDEANKRGYHLILCHSDDNIAKEIKAINLLREKRVDGLLIAPTRDPENRDNIEVYQQLQREKISLVFINEYFKEIETSYVITDDKAGAYQAVEHLIKLGHRRISYISGPLMYLTCQNRLKGYKEALSDSDIDFNPVLVKESGFSEKDGYRSMKELLQSDVKPTALFAMDPIIVGVWQAIIENGLRVPDDIAIVGYGGDIMKEAPMPLAPLTTMKQPAREIGKIGARILIDEIEKKTKTNQKIILPAKLIIRTSCGA